MSLAREDLQAFHRQRGEDEGAHLRTNPRQRGEDEELEPIDVVKNHSAEIAELKRARKKRIYLPRATVDSTVALSLCLMSSSSTNRNLTISVSLVYRRKLTTQSVAKRPQEECRGED